MGYKVLEPLNKPIVNKADDENLLETKELRLHLERIIKGLGKVEADGIRTAEGFVVLHGSHIATALMINSGTNIM